MKKYFFIYILMINCTVSNAQVIRHDSIKFPVQFSENYFNDFNLSDEIGRKDSINAMLLYFAENPGNYYANAELIKFNFDYIYPFWHDFVFTLLENCDYNNLRGAFNVVAYIRNDPGINHTLEQLYYHLNLDDKDENIVARSIIHKIYTYSPYIAQTCLEQLKKTDENAEQDEWIYWANYLKSNRTHDKKVLTEFYKIFEEKKYFHTGPGYKKQIIEVMEDRVWNKK